MWYNALTWYIPAKNAKDFRLSYRDMQFLERFKSSWLVSLIGKVTRERSGKEI